LAAAARISATRAALAAAFAAHQTYGAFGVLDDGPVGWLSRRIQEYATLEPSVRRCRSELSLGVIDALDADIVGRAGTP
jgi:alkylation response protein AidB-like acyl-CoA dehydrogenase